MQDKLQAFGKLYDEQFYNQFHLDLLYDMVCTLAPVDISLEWAICYAVRYATLIEY